MREFVKQTHAKTNKISHNIWVRIWVRSPPIHCRGPPEADRNIPLKRNRKGDIYHVYLHTTARVDAGEGTRAL